MRKYLTVGSTLLELLIILVITGLLVQVALPHYQAFVQKAQAQERLSDLLSLQTELESCYFLQMDYRPCAEDLQSPSSGVLEKSVEQFEYRLSLQASQVNVVCYRFETNSIHELMVYDAAGEVQRSRCL